MGSRPLARGEPQARGRASSPGAVPFPRALCAVLPLRQRTVHAPLPLLPGSARPEASTRTLTLWSLEQVAIRRPWKSKETSWIRSLWSAAMLRATNMASAGRASSVGPSCLREGRPQRRADRRPPGRGRRGARSACCSRFAPPRTPARHAPRGGAYASSRSPAMCPRLGSSLLSSESEHLLVRGRKIEKAENPSYSYRPCVSLGRCLRDTGRAL